MRLSSQLRWLLTSICLCGMVGLSLAKSCEELGKQGENWVTIDGTWRFVDGIDHIPTLPNLPNLRNNAIRIAPDTSMYALEGWHVSMTSGVPEDFVPPEAGEITEVGFATFVGVLGIVTQNDGPVIEPEDIRAVGAFLAPFQTQTFVFTGPGALPEGHGEIHYNKGTLGFEGIHGTLTYQFDPFYAPPADGPWVGCFHVPEKFQGE